MSSKPIRCFVDPHANPASDSPSYFVSLPDADDRVALACCYWVDQRTIQYYGREAKSREHMIAAGTFEEAWKQIPSGPTRITVWQMPRTTR